MCAMYGWTNPNAPSWSGNYMLQRLKRWCDGVHLAQTMHLTLKKYHINEYSTSAFVHLFKFIQNIYVDRSFICSFSTSRYCLLWVMTCSYSKTEYAFHLNKLKWEEMRSVNDFKNIYEFVNIHEKSDISHVKSLTTKTTGML